MSTAPVNGDHGPWTPISGSGLAPHYTYEQLERYYAGRQPISFLPPSAVQASQGRLQTLIVNWPRLVIDSLEELLDVEGFRLDEDSPADANLWNIWQANRLDVGSQLCHAEALLHGQAYALVWAAPDDAIDSDGLDPEAKLIPQITIESSELMSVVYDPTGTRITRATKQFTKDDTAYTTVYYADRVERYASDSIVLNGQTAFDPNAWDLREDPIEHDLGQVPVVAFVNRPLLSRPWGESEIADIIPIADAINKLGTDLMVTSESYASPRRWVTGIEMGTAGNTAEQRREEMRQKWSQAEKDRVWGAGVGAQFGQFQEASLSAYTDAINLLTTFVAALAGLTPQDLGINPQGNPASADARIAAESQKLNRGRRRQRWFGESWEDTMRLALKVQGTSLSGTDRMETIWRDPATQNVAQVADAAVKWSSIGMPWRQILETANYTPTAITRIQDMATDDQLKVVEKQVTAADSLVKKFGISRAAALAAVGLADAAAAEAKVEPRQPAVGPEVDDALLGGPAPAVDQSLSPDEPKPAPGAPAKPKPAPPAVRKPPAAK